jgi:hypothetical protein
MKDLDPHDVSKYESMIDFFCRHPPPEDDDVGEEYLGAVRAWATAGDNLVSVIEVTRRRVTILGCEVVLFERPFVGFGDGENYTVGRASQPIATVLLPDGSPFDIESADDLAALRAMLQPPVER